MLAINVFAARFRLLTVYRRVFLALFVNLQESYVVTRFTKKYISGYAGHGNPPSLISQVGARTKELYIAACAQSVQEQTGVPAFCYRIRIFNYFVVSCSMTQAQLDHPPQNAR